MNKFEFSLSILKEILLKDMSENIDILEKTKIVMDAFEEIYKRVSKLETHESLGEEDSDLLFSQAIKDSLMSEDYEGFRERMRSKILEKPEILNFNHLSDEGLRGNIRETFASESFDSFKEALGGISPDFFVCSSSKPCPFCSFKSILERANSYQSLKQMSSSESF
jgi:hypothetical protein